MYGYGIDAQKSKIDAYLSLFDVEVEEVNYYIDEGISAKNLNRPEVKMLKKIKWMQFIFINWID